MSIKLTGYYIVSKATGEPLRASIANGTFDPEVILTFHADHLVWRASSPWQAYIALHSVKGPGDSDQQYRYLIPHDYQIVDGQGHFRLYCDSVY